MNNFFTTLTFLFITYFSFSQSYESKIDSIVSLHYSSNDPGISILVAKEGKAIYQKALGKSNLELNTPIHLYTYTAKQCISDWFNNKTIYCSFNFNACRAR